MGSLHHLTAAEAARAIRAKEISAEDLAKDCLARIRARDGTLKAWTYLDEACVLKQARAADALSRSGAPLGPLHGVPVGVKDVLDTKDFPTAYGSPLHAGRRPAGDATAVARLRQAGAVILGKTVTAEFATLSPGPTTNPHDPERTPGGSSSGSAAAVAAFMTPLAVGTQTNGSMIRPASYCGVVGYKPTFGLISCYGALCTSRNLDHVGVYARTIEDAALAADVMIGSDPGDPDTAGASPSGLAAHCAGETLRPPRFAFVKGPAWCLCDEDVRSVFGQFVDGLGGCAAELRLDPVYDEVFSWQRIVMEADIAKNLGPEADRAGTSGMMSDTLKGIIARGRQVREADYALGRERMATFARDLDEALGDFDAILTPAATCEAPKGLGSTGNPACATLWTFTGMPAVSLPLLSGASGMPLGVQVVGRRKDDARLFAHASWLSGHVGASASRPIP